jgi:GH24 family phage-related lysozyme (muramidase)
VIGARGVDIIMKAEGFRAGTYVPNGDKSGVTIGYGYDIGGKDSDAVFRDLTHAGVDQLTATILSSGSHMKREHAKQFAKLFEPYFNITEPQALKLFQRESAYHADRINSLVKVPLNQNQFDALVSLHYNFLLNEKSSIIAALNSNRKTNYTEAADEFRVYNKVTKHDSKGRKFHKVEGGLVKRREQERTLFLAPM